MREKRFAKPKTTDCLLIKASLCVRMRQTIAREKMKR